MSILGINCATERIGVAVLHNGQLTEKHWQGQTIKAEQLIPFIAETLTAAGCTLTDVSAVAVAVGPGAFTGLRLSIVTAKTICLENSSLHPYIYTRSLIPAMRRKK